MNLGKDIWLPISWSDSYSFLAAMVPISHARSRDFIEVWAKIFTPVQDGSANLEIIYVMTASEIYLQPEIRRVFCEKGILKTS